MRRLAVGDRDQAQPRSRRPPASPSCRRRPAPRRPGVPPPPRRSARPRIGDGQAPELGPGSQASSAVPGRSMRFGVPGARPCRFTTSMLRAGHERAEFGQVTLGVMLAQVHGQVRDPAGMRLVVAQGPAPSARPTRSMTSVAVASTSARTRRARSWPPSSAVVGIGVDFVGRRRPAPSSRSAARRRRRRDGPVRAGRYHARPRRPAASCRRPRPAVPAGGDTSPGPGG